MKSPERYAFIDVLRGLALFGVVAVNVLTSIRQSLFQEFLASAPARNAMDAAVEYFVQGFLEMKAFAIFSLLFGISLAIQYDRLEGTTRPLYWLTRRQLVLLLFGLIHLVFIWNGDILTEYAVAGLIVLAGLGWPPWMLLLASLAMFALYLGFSWVSPVRFPSPAELEAHVHLADHVHKQGMYLEALRFSLSEWRLLLPLHVWVFPRTLALMFLGAFLWKSGLLLRPPKHKGALLLAGALALASTFLSPGLQTWLVGAGQSATASAIDHIFQIIAALGYVALIIAGATSSGFIGRCFAVFAPIGRMAFTNYIIQSVIFTGLFFGYGLGLYGLDAPSTLLIVVAVYALQVAASAIWLRFHRYGPLEWLWRRLAFGKRAVTA